jgi:hypothetical protein
MRNPKRFQKSLKHNLKFIYLFISLLFSLLLLLLPFSGFTNPTPLNENIVLKISKKEDTKGLVCNLAFSL